MTTTIGVMRRAGDQTGTLPRPEELDWQTAGVSFLWASQIYAVLPAVREVTYDTAAARVEAHYDESQASAEAMVESLDRLVDVALDTIGGFLSCDKSRLRQMAIRFHDALRNDPIDIAVDGAEDQLRKLVREVLSG